MRIARTPAFLLPALLLTGCALTTTAPPTPYTGAPISGHVHGGQQPVPGAAIYLYAASTTGYGAASTSLLNSNVLTNSPHNSGKDSSGNYYVTTDVNGDFSITNDYACTAGQQVYAYAIGGNPGAGTNAGAGFLAILGNCPGPSFSASLTVWMNEISTVAAAYAFAGFATDATHVGSSGTALALQGISNAFANAANLAGLSTGASLTSILGGYGTAPQATVNTLADILAACVNSNGAVTGGTTPTPCYTLFYNARASGSTGAIPSETATAAINIAHNPGQNIATLYGSPSPTGPFTPTLSTQPNDFTLGLQLRGGGLDVPYNIAIDGYGNAWLPNDGPSISVFGPSGAPVSPSTGGFSNIGGYTTGLQGPYQLAIDTSNNVWISEADYGLVVEYSNTGTPAYVKTINTSPYTYPGYLAVDPSGNVWVTESYSGGTGTIFEIPAGSTTISAFTGGGLSDPYGIASDAAGNIWVANNATGTVSEFMNNGTPYTASPFTAGGAYSYPRQIAAGLGTYIYVPSYADTLTILNQAGGNYVSGGTAGAGGLADPNSIAIDGAGNAWIANSSTYSNTVSEFTSAGVPISTTAGYGYGSLYKFGAYGPEGVAVDGSGNVWIADSYTGNGGSVVELIGAAVPTITPVAAAVKANTIGTRP